MRILIVSNNSLTNDGWGRYTENLKKSLKALGHEVFSIEDVFLSINQKKKLKDPVSYTVNPLAFLQDIFLFKEAIKTFNPEIIHFTLEPYIALLAFASVGTKKTVLTVHGTYAYVPALFTPGPRKSIHSFVYERAFSKINRIIAVSNYTKKHLVKYINKDIAVIHNGIEASQTYISDVPATNTKLKKNILMVGTVKPRKGLLQSIDALAVYKQKYGGDFEYSIVGTYEPLDFYYKSLLSRIDELGLRDNVNFYGSVSEKDLIDMYKKADLYLMLPIDSAGRFEGFGLVYLEANAFGVPVIGSIDSGASEAILDGKSGYTVDAFDKVLVADKIMNIIDKSSIDRAGCRKWAESHDMSKVASDVVDIYKSL